MKTKRAVGVVWCLFALLAARSDAALTHSPLTSMTATASGSPTLGQPPIPNDPAAQILTLNGISVSALQLGTTTFSGTPSLSNQLPQYADEFGLSANASADNQTYVQTMFPRPTKMVFLIEKGGNDGGAMVGLDALGQEIGLPAIPFTSAGFNKTLGYNVYEQQVAGGMVITSDILIHGIRFNAPGIDPVSISSVPIPEPASIVLAYVSVGAIWLGRRRRR